MYTGDECWRGGGAVGSPSVKNLKNLYWNGFMTVEQTDVFIIKRIKIMGKGKDNAC